MVQCRGEAGYEAAHASGWCLCHEAADVADVLTLLLEGSQPNANGWISESHGRGHGR